mgnify:CR=1 FL=1
MITIESLITFYNIKRKKEKNMELKKFISQFVEQFDNLDVSTINGETYFKEMDVWTSMAALMIIGMIDDEYGVEISAKDIRSAETIADLFELVKTRKNV